MNIQQLLHHLKHGYSYTATNEGGEPYQVLNPPNKYMIQAAKIIEKVLPEIEQLTKQAIHSREMLWQAHADCERLTKELNDAQKTIQDQLRNPLNGNSTGDPAGSTS
jgi:hypothetical protein